MTTDITELAQRLATCAKEDAYTCLSPADCSTLVKALEKAQQRIEELESDLSEWTDCKHDGATYYDMSGQERCGRCGADI
ncbi:hypothetical protein V5C53_000348 [Klebsiella pneumoniae]